MLDQLLNSAVVECRLCRKDRLHLFGSRLRWEPDDRDHDAAEDQQAAGQEAESKAQRDRVHYQDDPVVLLHGSDDHDATFPDKLRSPVSAALTMGFAKRRVRKLFVASGRLQEWRRCRLRTSQPSAHECGESRQ